MIFKYDPASLRREFKEAGFVHLRDIVSDDFIAQMTEFLKTSMRDEADENVEWKIPGKKRQFVFNFATDEDAAEFRAGMSSLTGIPEDRFTLSERHLKVYDDAAEPWPAPHKDRSASVISIGLPVQLGEGSSVCFFPSLDAGENPDDRATFLDLSNVAGNERLYDGPDVITLNEKVGDIVVFLGSALYHERIRAANSAVLYFKANGDGRDPLHENIFAPTEEP